MGIEGGPNGAGDDVGAGSTDVDVGGCCSLSAGAREIESGWRFSISLQ